MSGEYNHMEELGLTHDKQFICSCKGFIDPGNSTRGLCERFIPNGGKFYDLVSRYNNISAHLLNRDDGRYKDAVRCVAPFLKAFGATDYGLYAQAKKDLTLMPESGRVMRYLINMLPTFVNTTAYEHYAMALCEALAIPRAVVDCTEVEMDSYDLGRQEARTLREFASEISSLRLSSMEYKLNVQVRLPRDDVELVERLDGIFRERLPSMNVSKLMRDVKTMGTDEKAYCLLETSKRNQIDLEGTAYVGGDLTDYQAMDVVRDSSGLSLSFNGSDFAVRGSNVAVMSRDCTVAAVLVHAFYNEGIEAVFDLAENWNRDHLRTARFPDRHLMEAMLASNPKKLPEVHIVSRRNVDEIALKSERYRKNLMQSALHSNFGIRTPAYS
ncbi:MAG: hypothetical protein LBT41_06350 [Candidatus Methanoplasma sp.]|jgi:predicted HAD superfamily phosphohydrolase|nr:hypothetical protein [Candidatus Methanoplasma sp.]